MPIQQMLLGGGGAVATKTYVDDVFNTHLMNGNASYPRTVTTGIDFSGEEGLLIGKSRSNDYGWVAWDTVRGAGDKALRIDSNQGENGAAVSAYVKVDQFNNNGFRYNQPSSTDVLNGSGLESVFWSFRKAPGFCDIKTWNGNSTAGTQITHNLGCVPGLIIVKSTNASGDWMVYHRDVGNEYRLKLNSDTNKGTGTSSWNDTTPTSTYVELGSNTGVNATGTSYVGYFFAGGESTAATARSVGFDMSDDYLSIGTSSDFNLSTNDFTIEAFFKPTASTNSEIGNYSSIITMGWPFQLYWHEGRFRCWVSNLASSGSYFISGTNGNFETGANSAPTHQWHHVAVTRSGNTFRLFLNGVLKKTITNSTSIPNTTDATGIGRFNPSSSLYALGYISNVRLVNGTAVYTSSFRPPTEPLTNITNTKLLCCNNSSTTGSTVTPGTITASGGPTASSDSPFDDPNGFAFGKNEDQNVIKCGSYVGNGSTTGPEINLGWEPQWILIKNADDSSSHWRLVDSMRGIVDNGNDAALYPNLAYDEEDVAIADLTPTGFKITTAQSYTNANNKLHIYIAIRRTDGYVGKPPELGTDVFAMDTGNGSSTIPVFDSGFPVDFAFMRNSTSTMSWYTYSRLTQTKELELNSTGGEGGASDYVFDSNVGWGKGGDSSSIQSWMWKRHAGMDVVTYSGKGGSKTHRHNLNAVPQMIWVKCRANTGKDWWVYNYKMNGGTNPENYYLKLNSTNVSFTNQSEAWNDTAPTATAFTVGSNGAVNGYGDNYIAMLFTSVDSISKVDGYDGDANAQDKTISCGFQPRFVIAKCSTVGGSYNHWFVFDSVRGAGSGNDKTLRLDVNEAQTTNQDIIEFTSNGFIVKAGYQLNEGSRKYIYYAHA